MKLTKLTVFMVALMAVAQSAMAVGPRTKLDEYNGGEYICADKGPGLKHDRAPAVVRGEDERRQPANNKSAQ